VSERDLVADVAHQVKTPLAVIRGYAELLGARDDDATRREAAAQIREATDVLDLMVDDLIVVFALEAGVLPLELEPLDLAEAAEAAVARVSSRFARHTFTPRFDGASLVYADAEHVGRILGTLLLNACRLSPEGGKVGIDGRNAGEDVTVSISDSGPGLSEEELAAAFERHGLSPAIERSEVRSTGLELYKVRRLVELHGGTVKAESRLGHGSTFSFTLPR
jgi:two-component system, OmpR family, sensor histidine kinase BaeS